MPRLRTISPALFLLICAGCSDGNEITSAPPSAYRGIPAGLMAPCVVQDVPLATTADMVISRGRWKAGFEECAAKIDAIRAHDAIMRSR
ncbi:Rz1-like lysis system protein LysC [Croceibacterium xixiisoli]